MAETNISTWFWWSTAMAGAIALFGILPPFPLVLSFPFVLLGMISAILHASARCFTRGQGLAISAIALATTLTCSVSLGVVNGIAVTILITGTITLTLLAWRGPDKNWKHIGRMALIALLAYSATIETSWPLLLRFRISQPALEHLAANAHQRADAGAPTWAGLFPIDAVDTTDSGIEYFRTGSSVLVHASTDSLHKYFIPWFEQSLADDWQLIIED